MIRPATLATILIAATLAGCDHSGGPTLVVATTWDLTVREDLERAFRREGGSIAWVVVGPEDFHPALLGGRPAPDLILGVPEPALVHLADAGRLTPLDPDDAIPWRLVRRPSTAEVAVQGPSAPVYADPRDDPATLAEARAVLAAGGWPEGYRNLARRAATARPVPGRPAGSTTALSGPGVTPPSGQIEAAAIVRDGPRVDEARRFLKLMQGLDLVRPPLADAPRSARADGLLADLLGAALVDAHAELRAAEVAVRRSTRPGEADAAFGDRPPWPPASVTRLRAGASGGTLVETLAEQLAPDPESKAWLLESWSSPKRPIDGSTLADLAGAADGRLAREPRFRAWLRAEWAAWHRQLYRRVARVAGGYVPS